MAIKGKARRRARTRGPAHPPRPQIPAPKLHLLQRKDLRRALVIVLSVALLLGGLRVWQNISRSDSLKRYDRALGRAQSKLLTALDSASSTSLMAAVQAFAGDQIPADSFKALAEGWEKDFKAAEDAAAKVTPPAELRDAHELIVQGIDQYVGVARLLQSAAAERELADAQKEAKIKAAISDRVEALLVTAQDWLQRASAIWGLGQSKLVGYKSSWHVVTPSVPGLTDSPTG